ncbi:MAG: hypothetical protein LBR81_02910 [Prevotellaceae bacterium]|nr:hypothetical protein [Prevotellaceae bacterium]
MMRKVTTGKTNNCTVIARSYDEAISNAIPSLRGGTTKQSQDTTVITRLLRASQ